ncbi:MAG: ctpA 1 [Thermoleophilia bacterium]|nr:ctpA 1 [Thermoleophilia bacterium]
MVCRAALLESHSAHPVARAIVAYQATDGLQASATVALGASREDTEPLDVVDHAGVGVEAVMNGSRVVVGRPSLFEADWDLPDSVVAAHRAAQHRGSTSIWVGWEGSVRGIIELADTLAPHSADAVRQLRSLGLRPLLVTGDNVGAAQHVADQLGIADVIADVLPSGKVAAVRELQASGAVVAMVGDGVNDAAALAQADLGIAIGSGAEVAIEAADLTIVSGDPRGAATAVRLARRTLSIIRGNLFWAFAYNAAGIPLAAAGLLDPMYAGGAMALSSLCVVGNSLRLRGFE